MHGMITKCHTIQPLAYICKYWTLLQFYKTQREWCVLNMSSNFTSVTKYTLNFPQFLFMKRIKRERHCIANILSEFALTDSNFFNIQMSIVCNAWYNSNQSRFSFPVLSQTSCTISRKFNALFAIQRWKSHRTHDTQHKRHAAQKTHTHTHTHKTHRKKGRISMNDSNYKTW